jgi:tetratricopeptide (TPR) repeat protein
MECAENNPMAEPTMAKTLEGQRIAFTGRFASMTRAQAIALVRRQGGEWQSSVTRGTSILVIGQDGWALGEDGRLSRKLQKARALKRKQAITILTESQFLGALGLESREGSRRLSTAELSEVLQVPGDRIRTWVRHGLVHPAQTVEGVHYFDFQQARWAKSLCELVQAGVTLDRIRRSLRQLGEWLPGVEHPLSQLAVLEQDGQLVVRLKEGQLAEPTGQGLFDFAEASEPTTVPVTPSRQGAEDWFQLGCEHEEAGRLLEAAKAYRRALLQGGPEKEACFNLANVLYALGRKEHAAERFWQAVEMDPAFVEAWNNLGNVLSELGQLEEAVEALQKVIALDHSYADAHYNLADTFDQLGREEEALAHWQTYLRYDSTSPWGRYARKRLDGRERPKQA